jgi:hypothetical protein
MSKIITQITNGYKINNGIVRSTLCNSLIKTDEQKFLSIPFQQFFNYVCRSYV